MNNLTEIGWLLTKWVTFPVLVFLAVCWLLWKRK